MPTQFIKAINIQILTLATPEGVPDERIRPIIRLELDDGRQFVMGGIPADIAYNISYELSELENRDTRLQIYSLVGQLALIDKVEIDMLVPGSEVYQATIYIKPEGFTTELQFQMVPSNAILLAVANDAPIYVANELVIAAESQQE